MKPCLKRKWGREQEVVEILTIFKRWLDSGDGMRALMGVGVLSPHAREQQSSRGLESKWQTDLYFGTSTSQILLLSVSCESCQPHPGQQPFNLSYGMGISTAGRPTCG